MMNWLKLAFFRGLVILIPLILLWITIRELAGLLVTFAEPIADLMPAAVFDWVKNPELVAPVFIVAIALLLGAMASLTWVRKVGGLLERNTVGNFPLYRMIKIFVTAFLEVEDTTSFRPALIVDDEGGAEPCYVIEDSEGGENVVVLVPWSPASFAGSVKLVPRQRIKRLNLTFDEFSLSLANFGLGMSSIMGSEEQPVMKPDGDFK